MSIFQQYLQPVRSLTQRMADFDALDMQREDLTARRQQNALQALAARKAIEADEVAREDGNQLQRLAGQYGSDQNAFIQALRGSGRVGLMGRADALEKALLERQKADAAVGKDKAETLKTHLGALKTLAGGVMANPTAEAAMFAIDAFERFTGRQMPEERARIAQLQTPDDVKRWAAGHALSADKLLPQVQNRDTGGQVQTLAIDPLTGRPTVTGAVDKTVTPDAVMADKRTREEGAANRGVQMRGQNMADARAKEKNASDAAATSKVEWRQDTNGNWVALPKAVDMSGGPVTPVMTTVPGKREVQAGQALEVIKQAEQLISKGTSSYLGAARDEAARVVGASTGAADAAAQLKALEGALMMAQPRMEGPQSNLDVELYRQMAGRIGDRTVPVSQKQAAIAEIKRLHTKYAGPGKQTPAAPSDGKPSVSNW